MGDHLSIADQITAEALSLGFDDIGFTSADHNPIREQRLEAFVEAGRHGTMAWMENRRRERASPKALWKEARSAVMLAVNYGPEDDPLDNLERRERATISVYAQNKDYHDLIKKRLKKLARWMVDAFECEVKVFVDTAPVMEKPLAAAAGIGWQGKHTNLVSQKFGSWLFLGAIYTTLDLTESPAENDHCGTCRACLDICPTDAFPAPYQLDARRCISYLTIEHAEPIPKEFRKAIGNRIYGCDDCLAACPWNKFARVSAEQAFHPRDALKAPLLETLAGLDDAAFRAYFSGSPIKRIKRDRFVRNVLIAIGNSGNTDLLGSPLSLRKDPSPLVRGAAIWALSQLLPPIEFQRLANVESALEPDKAVRAEWSTE